MTPLEQETIIQRAAIVAQRNAARHTAAAATLVIPSPKTVPHLDQWFGWWHYEPQRAAALFDNLRNIDVAAHVRQWKADAGGGDGTAGLVVRGGSIAVVSLCGSLMKHLSSLDNGTSTVLARQAIRKLIADDTAAAVTGARSSRPKRGSLA